LFADAESTVEGELISFLPPRSKFLRTQTGCAAAAAAAAARPPANAATTATIITVM
jgi:hypothetical protein